MESYRYPYTDNNTNTPPPSMPSASQTFPDFNGGQFINKSATSSMVNEKRSVAKKACLSCREKKIKCDGELLTSYPDNPNSKITTYKTCSNCKATGLECIFVPSKRGGRRKKKNGTLSVSGMRSENSSMVSMSNSNIHNDDDDDDYENEISRSLVNANTSNGFSYRQLQHQQSQQQQPQPYYPLHYLQQQQQQSDNNTALSASQQGYAKQPSQQQNTSQAPWMPYGLPIYPDANAAYAFQMQNQSKSSSNSNNNTNANNSGSTNNNNTTTSNGKNNNDNNNNNTTSDSKMPQNGYDSSSSYQQKDKRPDVCDNRSQVSSTSNLPDNNMMNSGNNKPQQPPMMQNRNGNMMANPYMYQYQYPYYLQDPQQQPGMPPLPRQQQQQAHHPQSQSDMAAMQHLHPHLPQNPNALGQLQLQLQHQYQYPYQQPPQLPYFQHPAYMLPQHQSYPPPPYPENPYQNAMNMNNNSNGMNYPNTNVNQRQMKYVDFEDKNSNHYLKKKVNKETDSVVSFASGSSNSSGNSDDHRNSSEKDLTTENKGKLLLSNKNDRDHDKDNDSWSVSLAPSDSVTMIQSKRMRQEMRKYENKFQPISESDNYNQNIDVNNNVNNINENINKNVTNGKSSSHTGSNHSDAKNHSSSYSSESVENSSNMRNTNASSIPTSNSNSYGNNQKIKPEYLVTDISTTERWVDEQNNELKRTAIANEQEMKELHKRQKKYDPLKLDVKCPIFINPQLLESLKLPDIQTLYKLTGVYYKYSNPHTLILPNMTFFMDNLSASNDHIALLASIFKMAARYMSHNEVSNIWLEESHWEDVYNQVKDKISINFSIICSLIQCSRGDDDFINTCIKLINVTNMDQNLLNLSWNSLSADCKDSISSFVLLEREIMIRTYWCVYKSQLFRRLSFGHPYNKGEDDSYLKINKNVELPLPDIKYYKETEKLQDFKKLYNKKLSLSSISTTYPDGSILFDSACYVVSLILLEEVIDSISNKTLFSYTILRFSHRLNKNFQTHDSFKHLQPYQLETHPKKEPHIIINASNFSSTFVNRMTCLVLSIGLCNKILIYSPKSTKPVRSQINPFNDLSLIQVDPKSIIEKSNQIEDIEERFQNWTWFFKAMDVVYDMLLLLELGDGVCSATLTETKPIDEVFETVIGPCCAGSSVVEEWCKYNTWTMNVSNVPVENQGWIQMSGITVWGMVQAWSFLSSMVLCLEVLDVVVEEKKESEARDGEEEEHEDIILSENEDEERKQVTGDAGRIDSQADFKKKVKRDNYNVGSTCNIEDYKEYKDKTIKVVAKETGETLVSGIEFKSAPMIFHMLLKNANKSDGQNEARNKIIEKMKVIRKYLGIMEKYFGDCKIAGVYCDKILDYIFKLTN